MGVVVQFSYVNFVAQFPALAYLTSSQVQTQWNLATNYVRNDGGGPVISASVQSNLINLAAAHLCQLFMPPATGGSASTLVGRINSASEGSVSVGAEMNSPQAAAWWITTVYGAAFWEASKQYRTMRYLPGPRRWMNPWPMQ